MALSRAKTFTRQKKTAVLQAMKERKYQLPVAIFDVREVNVLVFKVPNKDLRNYDGDGKENVKKAIGLMSKTTTLHVHHAFLYISLPSLHNYDVKWPNFKFTWERERQGDKFYHLGLNSCAVPSLQLQPKFPSFK